MARAGVSTDEEVAGPEGETNGRPAEAKTASWLRYNVYRYIGAVVVAPLLLLDRGYCGFICSDVHLHPYGRQLCRDPCDGSRVSMRGWTDWAPFRILVIAALLYLVYHTDLDGLLHHVLCVSDWVGEAIVWAAEHVWHALSRARQPEGTSALEDGGITHGRTAEREGGSGSDTEEEGKHPDMDRLDDCARSMAHILRLSDDALRTLILQKVPEADIQQVLGLLHEPRAQVASAAGLPTETAVLQKQAHDLAFFLGLSDHALRRMISRTAPHLDVEREVGVVRWVRRLVESSPIEASTPSPSPAVSSYSHALSVLSCLSDDALRALMVQQNIPEARIAPLLALVRAAQPEGHQAMPEVQAASMLAAVLPPQEPHLPSPREGGRMQAEALEDEAETPREGAMTALDEDSLGALEGQEGQAAASIASLLDEAVGGRGQQRSSPFDLQASEPLEEEEEGSDDEQPEVPQGAGSRAGQPPRRKHMRTGPINRRQPFGPGVRTADRTGMRILDLSPETLARLNRFGVLPHVSARVPLTESSSTNASIRPLEGATQLVPPVASLVQTGGTSNDPSRTLPRPLSASPARSQQATSQSAASTSAAPTDPSRRGISSTVAPQSLQTAPTPAIPPVTSTQRPMAWPIPYVPSSLGPRAYPQTSPSQPNTSTSGAPLNPSTAPPLQAAPGAVTIVSPLTPAESPQTAPPPIAQAPSPYAIGLSHVTQLTLDSILAARRRMASRLPAPPSIPQVAESIIEQPSAHGEEASATGQPEVATEAEGINATSETSVEGEDKSRRRRRRRKKRQSFIPLDEMEKTGEEEQEEDEEEEEERATHMEGQAAKTEERSLTPAQQMEAALGQEELPQEGVEEMPGGRMPAEADPVSEEERQRAVFALYEQLHKVDVDSERLSCVLAAREKLRKESTPAQQVGPSTSATAEPCHPMHADTSEADEHPQPLPSQARPPQALPPQDRMAPLQSSLLPPGLLQESEPPAIGPSPLAHLPARALHLLPPPGLPPPPTLPLPRPIHPPRSTPVRIQSFGFVPLPSPFPWGSLQATRGPLLSYLLRPRPPSPFLRPRPFLPTRPPTQSYTWLPYPSRHPWPRNMGSWYASYKTPTSRAPIGTSPSRFPRDAQPGPRLYSPFGSSFPGLGPQAVGYANATQPGAQGSSTGTSYQSTTHAAALAPLPEATVVARNAGHHQVKVKVKEEEKKEEKEDEEEGEGAAASPVSEETFVRLGIHDEEDTEEGEEEEGQGITAVVGEGPHVSAVSEPHDQKLPSSDSQAATAGEESETISFTWELDEEAARDAEEEGGEPLVLRCTGGSDSEASDDSERGRNAVEIELLSSVPSSPRDGSDKGSTQVPAAYHRPRFLRIPSRNYHDSSQIQSGTTPAAVATGPPPAAAASPPVAQTTEPPQANQPAAANSEEPAATPEPPAAKLSRQEVRRAARAAQKQAAREARLHGLPPPSKAQSSHEAEHQAQQAPTLPPSFARGPLPTVDPALRHLHCPASHRLLTDPIIAADGVTYARSAFKEHITYCYQSGQPYTSLMDKQTVLPSLVILPNLFARRQVQEYQRRLREGR